MNGVNGAELTAPLARIGDQLLALAPRAALALFCLLAGLIVAYVAARTTRWLVRRLGLDALAERAGAARVLYGVGIKQGLPEVLGRLVWLAVALLTLAVVAETAGLPGVAEGLGALTEFIPRLVAAGLIVLGGVLAADLLRGLVGRVARRRGDVHDPALAGAVVYYLVLVVTFTLAAEQLGFATDLINRLILVVVAGVLFSFGLAFALGSRETFRGLIARHYAERRFRPGDRVTLGEIEGIVVQYASLSVVLRTDAGKIVLPCARLMDTPVRLDDLPPPPDDGEAPRGHDDAAPR